MKKFRLLLLDANIVIEIFRLGLWERIVARCDVHLSRTVCAEAIYFDDDNGNRQTIDMTASIRTGAISVFDVSPSELTAFRDTFDPVYFEKLDPGETESLAYLLRQNDECQICSADKILYRVLGNLHRGEQGISLEEILQGIGLAQRLSTPFTKAYRELWTAKGFQEKLYGIGRKDNPPK